MLSTDLALVLVMIAWVVIGLTLSAVMGRRGHDRWSWLVLGAILGPLAVVLAFGARHHAGEDGTGQVVREPTGAPGPIDVLVGADGSPESSAAAVGARALLGPRLGRLTLVTVIPFDAPPADEQSAATALAHQATELGDTSVGMEIVRGQPADALRETAATDGYEVLACGTRGRGRSRAVFGSVASTLARGSRIPVLMFDASTIGVTDQILASAPERECDDDRVSAGDRPLHPRWKRRGVAGQLQDRHKWTLDEWTDGRAEFISHSPIT